MGAWKSYSWWMVVPTVPMLFARGIGRGRFRVAAHASVAQLRLVCRDPRRPAPRAGQLLRRDGRGSARAAFTRGGVLPQLGVGANRPRARHSRGTRRSGRGSLDLAPVLGPLPLLRAAGYARGGIDVFGCNLTVRDQLLRLEAVRTSLVGQLIWLGFRRKTIPYTRAARQHGTSAWSWKKKMDYLLDSVFAFTDGPIKALLVTGSLGLLFSVVTGAVVLVAKISGAVGRATRPPCS